MSRTIILLSDFKSGSTAMLNFFKKHKHITVPHAAHFNHKKYGSAKRWEMRFWDLAADAIAGHPQKLIERMLISNPYLRNFFREQEPYTKERIFRLWDDIASRHGRVVFEKSPQYLESPSGLDLLAEYAKMRDVRFLSIIRQPTDCIPSMTFRWAKAVNKTWHHKNPEGYQYFENRWIYKYENLELFKNRVPVFSICYENFTQYPELYLERLFKFCGLDIQTRCAEGLCPTHVNYYYRQINKYWQPQTYTLNLYNRMKI